MDWKTIIIDQARFHRSKHLQDVCGTAGVSLLFLPPYSPDFTPTLEGIFLYARSLVIVPLVFNLLGFNSPPLGAKLDPQFWSNNFALDFGALFSRK